VPSPRKERVVVEREGGRVAAGCVEGVEPRQWRGTDRGRAVALHDARGHERRAGAEGQRHVARGIRLRVEHEASRDLRDVRQAPVAWPQHRRQAAQADARA